ncbi:hypothetical protein DFH27DRAFT_191548 [Peziza echinospora]|nr:hypothetical protein DFH27DRAFT_191548 [Peziza echinospora]
MGLQLPTASAEKQMYNIIILNFTFLLPHYSIYSKLGILLQNACTRCIYRYHSSNSVLWLIDVFQDTSWLILHFCLYLGLL